MNRTSYALEIIQMKMDGFIKKETLDELYHKLE